MAYWWANQNQTAHYEIPNGFLWSPKVKKSGAANPFYDNMGLFQPDDIVFSFSKQYIQHLGIITSPAITSPNPVDPSKGQEGWLVRVQWQKLPIPFRPKAIMPLLRPLLPEKYSPIDNQGNGNQHVYLAAVPNGMANVLLRIGGITDVLESFAEGQEVTLRQKEEAIQAEINNADIPETEKQALVNARIGQGIFRKNLEQIESGCRVTGVSDRRLLRASHIKPWRVSDNRERLDGNNGLLLVPHIDHLFDKGYISFKNNGDLICSSAIPMIELLRYDERLGQAINVGSFRKEQKVYLEYHRDIIFTS